MRETGVIRFFCCRYLLKVAALFAGNSDIRKILGLFMFPCGT